MNEPHGNALPREEDLAFLELAARCLDGQFSAEEGAELNDHLRGSAAKRDLFARFCLQGQCLAEMLALDAGETESARAPIPTVPVRPVPFARRHVMALAVSAALLAVGVVWLVVARFGTRPTDVAQTGGPGASVACLTRVAGGRFSDRVLAPGDRLTPGESLHLAAGVVEIAFDAGAKILLQGPAALEIESAKSARLKLGKATTEITDPAARGFRLSTPQATFVDQGTEFGVEVAPGGSSRIHVFQGAVDWAVSGQRGEPPSVWQRLKAHAGARLEGDTPCVTLLEDTGESFIRSLDEVDRDEHVIAYWRFEDQPLGTALPNTLRNTRQLRATCDSSFNGNDLFTYSPSSQPHFSAAVPAAIVPRTGAANRGCLSNTLLRGDDATTCNVYTHSQFSHAAPLDAQKLTPAEWTIEASVKPMYLGRGCQTFVGRDGVRHGNLRPAPPRLAFQITAADRFAIRYRDLDNRLHEAVAAEFVPRENQWYHLAATSDGRTLRLYVNALDGQGYQLMAATALPQTGATALGKGDNECEWSIGRGKPELHPDEWFQGLIDEVRISDVALAPSRFLFATQQP